MWLQAVLAWSVRSRTASSVNLPFLLPLWNGTSTLLASAVTVMRSASIASITSPLHSGV